MNADPEDEAVLEGDAIPPPMPRPIAGPPAARTFRRVAEAQPPSLTPLSTTDSVPRFFSAVATPAVVVQADPHMAAEIEQLLARHSTQALAAFETQMQALSAVIPDETTRLSAAFATLAALGISKENIHTAVQARIVALKNHERQFFTELGNELAQQSATNKQRHADICGRLEQLKRETDTLHAEAEAIEKRLGTIETEAESVRARFTVTYEKYYNELDALLRRLG